jgi:hypothetical protein
MHRVLSIDMEDKLQSPQALSPGSTVCPSVLHGLFHQSSCCTVRELRSIKYHGSEEEVESVSIVTIKMG